MCISWIRFRGLIITALALLLYLGDATRGQDAPVIEGVQSASMDQPRIYLNVRRTAQGALLAAKGTKEEGEVSEIEAFLDTGASGIVLSSDTIEKLNVQSATTVDGKPLAFEDVGVGGSEKFRVAEPLWFAYSNFPNGGGNDDARYSTSIGPFRAEIREEKGILAMISPGLDVAGMPLMTGKVVVLDPTPIAKLDLMHTSLLAPNDPAIPKTPWHVPLTYVRFDRFTRVTPANTAGPNQEASPMIGPDPFDARDRRKPIVIRHNGKTAQGTFLLDTGAATSMISARLAKALGLDLDENGKPRGLPKGQTFELAVGGLGGEKNSTGLFFDRLELPTREGHPIVFAKAPLLIADISVKDEQGNVFTLDGVFGMNYLVASAQVTGGLLPDIGEINDGPFKRIVIDHVRKEMGLDPQ